MKKNQKNSQFICTECGNEYSDWAGKCQYCGQWNTIKEVNFQTALSGGSLGSSKIEAKKLSSFDKTKKDSGRIKTGFKEIDRVFGGGIVPGSVVLVGGEPGVGKSTLLLQIVANLEKPLYLSGEESGDQIKLRADRLKIAGDKILISPVEDITDIENSIAELNPSAIIVDSIQTVYVGSATGTAGSQSQVKESGSLLQRLAKKYSIPVIIIGHVTKDGVVAGPRTLEHLVDVVIYIEGDRSSDFRILRTVKNRFGATDEIAVLKMTEIGIAEVDNPAMAFVSKEENSPGSAIAVIVEGTRPILAEIQTLVTPTAFGYPRRTCSGYDLNRLNLLIGVLTKKTGINLSNQDVYLNIAGGVMTKEPAADLAVCMALASSYKNIALPKQSVYFAEVTLTGNLRVVKMADRREKEAKKLGFIPNNSYQNIRDAISKSLGQGGKSYVARRDSIVT